MYRSTNSYTIMATGVNMTTGAASTSSALPNTLAGIVPRYVRITTTAAAHVRLGVVGLTAVATDVMVIAGESLVLEVPQGITHIAAIQDTAAGTVNVAPVEDC